MRYIYILIILGINYSIFSQTPRYITLGQIPDPNGNNCLEIRKKPKVLEKVREHISLYKELTAVKLVGFDEGDNQVDSLLAALKPMTHVQFFTFETCDLSALETSLAGFPELDQVNLLNTVFFENAFFPLLKKNKIKTLFIQSEDPELIMDSLHLLPLLTRINISSESGFAKPNHTQTLRIATQTESRNVDFSYFGDHYKANETGVITMGKGGTLPARTSTAIDYPCIRQPVPGIDINDTTFVFNASQKGNFTYESGTTLSIDRQAFITQGGKTYEGDVTVFYREFRNPVEIMLSGIPMTNKVNGESQVFKSGGMYEINAYGRNNEPLKVASDTSIKINFALTDTSQSFQFFSLNPDGSWTTTDQKVNAVSVSQDKRSDRNARATRAVKEYFWFINGCRPFADTMHYEARFADRRYLYTYRKDNLWKGSENPDTMHYQHVSYHGIKTIKVKGLFKVKYYKQTKEKDKDNKEKHIVFKIVPYREHVDLPPYIQDLVSKDFMYTGNLTKDQFKKMFNRQLQCWDLRPELNGDDLNFLIKTSNGFVELQGKAINLKEDRTYTIPKRGSYVLYQRMKRSIHREGRIWDRKDRINPDDYNDANKRRQLNKVETAYAHSKPFQNKSERAMNLQEWKKYVAFFASRFMDRSLIESENELGAALVKSGLGFKNIDCYIHSGQMQDIYVNYKRNYPLQDK